MIRRFAVLRRAIASHSSGEGRPLGGATRKDDVAEARERRAREDSAANAALFEHLRPRPNGLLGEREQEG